MDVDAQLTKYHSLIEKIDYFITENDVRPLSSFLSKNRCSRGNLVERISNFVQRHLKKVKIEDREEEFSFNQTMIHFKALHQSKIKELDKDKLAKDTDYDLLYIQIMNSIFLKTRSEKICMRDLYLTVQSQMIQDSMFTNIKFIHGEMQYVEEHPNLEESIAIKELVSANIPSMSSVFEAESLEVDSQVVDTFSFLTQMKTVLESLQSINKPDRKTFYSRENGSVADDILLSFFSRRSDLVCISRNRFTKKRKRLKHIVAEEYLKFKVSEYNFNISDLLVVLFLYEYFHNQSNSTEEDEIFTDIYCNYQKNTKDPVVLKLIQEIVYRKRKLVLSNNLSEKIEDLSGLFVSLFPRISKLKYHYVHEKKFGLLAALNIFLVGKLFEHLNEEKSEKYYQRVPYKKKTDYIEENLELINRIIELMTSHLRLLKSLDSYEKIEENKKDASSQFLGSANDTFFTDVIFKNMNKANQNKSLTCDNIFNFFTSNLDSEEQDVKDDLLLFLYDSGISLSESKKEYIEDILVYYANDEVNSLSSDESLEDSLVFDDIESRNEEDFESSSSDSTEGVFYEHEIYGSTLRCSYDIHPRILNFFKPSLNLVQEFPELASVSYAKQYWYKMTHDFGLVLDDVCMKFGHKGVYVNKSGSEQAQFTLPVKIVHDSDPNGYEIAKIVLTFDENRMYHRHITKTDQTEDIESHLDLLDHAIQFPELGSDRLSFDGLISSFDPSIEDCPDGSFIDIDRSTKHILCVHDPKNRASFYVPIV